MMDSLVVVVEEGASEAPDLCRVVESSNSTAAPLRGPVTGKNQASGHCIQGLVRVANGKCNRQCPAAIRY